MNLVFCSTGVSLREIRRAGFTPARPSSLEPTELTEGLRKNQQLHLSFLSEVSAPLRETRCEAQSDLFTMVDNAANDRNIDGVLGPEKRSTERHQEVRYG